MEEVREDLKHLITPELCLAVYHLKYPYAKGQLPSGTEVGNFHFRPRPDNYMQPLYNLIYHEVLLPMSKMPLESLLAVDFTELLPEPSHPTYPEHALGLITILDHTRALTLGYSKRYTHGFFDVICEKWARQLIALPDDIRPDGKSPWLSRGYSFEDWLVRTLWFWTPLVHSDIFMVNDRASLKDYLHSIRSEAESHFGRSDPFAPLEAEEDVDITAFQKVEGEGPPQQSFVDPASQANICDYTFWWIRILNSHFAITDMCGHYPYWIRWTGHTWSKEDKEFMRQNGHFRYKPQDEPVLQQIRRDFLEDVWGTMETNAMYESKDGGSGDVPEPGGAVLRKKMLGERGRGQRVRPNGSSMMPP